MWYYLLLGEELGPVTIESLMDMVRYGDLGPGDQVRPEEDPEWRMVAEIPELAELEYEPTSADLDAMLVDDGSAQEEEDTSSADELGMMLTEEEPIAKPPPKKEVRWYCKVLNQELGPFNFDALLEMVQDEEITREDLVRSDADENWMPAGSIMGLFTKGPSSKPLAAASGGILSPQRAAMFKAAPKRKEEQSWYNRVGGYEFGPVRWTILQAEVRVGKLSSNDEVRLASKKEWQRVTDVPELASLVVKRDPPVAAASAAPAPAPASAYAAPAATAPEPQPSSPPSYAAQDSYGSPSSYGSPPPRPAMPSGFGAARPGAPPPRSARSSPRRSSGGGGGMDFSKLFAGIKMDPKVMGGIGAGVLLVVLYFSGLLGPSDSPHVSRVQGIYDQVQSIAQAGGDDAAWQALAQSTEADRKEHQAELEEIASSKRPALRVLLDVYRYTLPEIFTGTKEKRTKALDIFEKQMEAADRTK